MDGSWSAIVDAEEDEEGFFVPVLKLFAPGSLDPLTVRLNGVYRTGEEAIAAGREAISDMASNHL